MYRILLTAGVFLALSFTAPAEVPQVINYQGRVVVGTTNFDGTGQFKFALVNANGSTTYWSHDGTSTAGSQPTSSISLIVSKGLYSVLLGDTSVPSNMTYPIPPSVFSNPDVRLRVWFNDGANGWQLMSPDQRIGSVGYALQAGVAGPWSLNGTTVSYNDGRVGIGTATPGSLLELFNVNGSTPLLKLNSTNGNTLFEARAAVPTLTLRDTIPSVADPAYGIIGAASRGLRFYTDKFWRGENSSAFMALNENGFLGIGTTTPLSALHVSGAADALRLTGSKPYLTLEDTSSSYPSRIQGDGGGVTLRTNGTITGSNPGGLLHLHPFGTVGLGTTTPSHQLTIVSNGGTPAWTNSNWLGAIALDNSAAIAWQANAAGQRFGMGHTNGSFLMWRTGSNPGTTGTWPIYDFAINDVGDVGIGTTAPAAKLQVVSSGNIGAPQALITQTTSGEYARLRFSATGSPSAWDVAGGSTGGVLNFYATSTGRDVMSLNPNGTTTVRVLSITGGADLAEPFPMAERNVPPGSVVSIDAKNPGKLRMSRSAYDKRAAGIVSGANGIKPGISMIDEEQLEPGENVSLSGRVYVKANRSGGPIEPGDLLTTSDIPGEAMRAADHDRAQGAIIGKAMTPLAEESGMVLVLVTLQ